MMKNQKGFGIVTVLIVIGILMIISTGALVLKHHLVKNDEASGSEQLAPNCQELKGLIIVTLAHSDKYNSGTLAELLRSINGRVDGNAPSDSYVVVVPEGTEASSIKYLKQQTSVKAAVRDVSCLGAN